MTRLLAGARNYQQESRSLGDVDLSYRNRYFVNLEFSGLPVPLNLVRISVSLLLVCRFRVECSQRGVLEMRDWLNTLRFRVSYGYTRVMPVFSFIRRSRHIKYSNDYRYYAGVGALPPITMGKHGFKVAEADAENANYGVTGGFLNDRLRVESRLRRG